MGSVLTFLDRDRRSGLGTVTELRRHEAIVAAGETGRWRVGYAGLQLIKAGPTGGTTIQQVVDHAAQLLQHHLNTDAPATWWRFRLAKRCSTVTHSLQCRDRWFRQRLTAKVRQRSLCPRCRSRIAWRINALGEGH